METLKEKRSRAGRLGANQTHKKRYELLKTVSSQVSKSDLNWIQSKWATDQIELLVKAWGKKS